MSDQELHESPPEAESHDIAESGNEPPKDFSILDSISLEMGNLDVTTSEQNKQAIEEEHSEYTYQQTKSREDLHLSKEASRIVLGLQKIMSSIQMYGGIDNKFVKEASFHCRKQIIKTLELTVESELDVAIKNHGFEVRAVPLFEARNLTGELVDRCKQHQIGSITFRRGVQPEELVSFSHVLRAKAPKTNPFLVITEKLKGLRVNSLILIENKEEELDLGSETARSAGVMRRSTGKFRQKGTKSHDPRSLYLSLIEFTKENQIQLNQGFSLQTKHLSNLCHDMAQLLQKQPDCLLPYAALRRMEPREISKPVNVAILSTSLACQYVSGTSELLELIKATMIMHLGRIPGLKTPSIAPDANHASKAAAFLDGEVNLSKLPMVLAFEQELGNDFKGQPAQPFRWNQNYYSHLIAISSHYVELTTATLSAQSPQPSTLTPIPGESTVHPSLSPAAALASMYPLAGTRFLHGIFELFKEKIGIYPLGSLVRLNSGEIAMILDRNNPAEIQVLTDARGYLLDNTQTIKALWQKEVADEPFICESLDANHIKISAFNYF